jgi:transposase-like protein
MEIPQQVTIAGQNRKKFSREQKLEAVLMSVAKKKKGTEICLDLKISRETLTEWKNKAYEGMAKALAGKEKGRKPKDYVEDEYLRKENEKLKKYVEVLKEQNKSLDRARRMMADKIVMMRKVIRFWEKNDRLDVKKNSVLIRVLKNVFYGVPKKPLKAEAKPQSIARC